ncbi:MAG TPA: DUF3617 family protein [Gammaproteobacteria bacterium]|nr:DUF3617 family protein [Gammaproteobacteria bacterium]
MRYAIVAFITFVFAAPVAFAANHIDLTGKMRPGLYEATTHMTIKGMGDMPAKTSKSCVTKEDLTDFGHWSKADPSAKITDVSLKGNHLHFKMTSNKGGGLTTMVDDIIFKDPEHYQFRGNISKDVNGQTYEMTMKSDAHRIGDCTDEQKK